MAENKSEYQLEKNIDALIRNKVFRLEKPAYPISPHHSAVFNINMSKLIDIADYTHLLICSDYKYQYIQENVHKLEFRYYATALLWLRLVSLKRERVSLSEKELCLHYCAGREFNIPTPLYEYLLSIGNYADENGVIAYLDIPDLPTATVGEFGGYHSSEVSLETHNLFEEVPCLGVVADSLMSIATFEEIEPPNYRINKPDGSMFTENLCGWIKNPNVDFETAKNLARWNITKESFPEYTSNTRFHYSYLKGLSDVLADVKTFKTESIIISDLPVNGAGALVIKTMPSKDAESHNGAQSSNDAVRNRWTYRNVDLSSPISSDPMNIKAIIFGFQLHKEEGPGKSKTDKHSNWSCVTGSTQEWELPDEWIDNRNARRNLPPEAAEVIGNYRFWSDSLNQQDWTKLIFRKMKLS